MSYDNRAHPCSGLPAREKHPNASIPPPALSETRLRGGFQALVGPTGGYLVGFLAAALLLWVTERLHRRNPWPLAACMLLGLFVCYAFGTAWYMTMQKAEWAKATVTSVLTVMVFPYLIPDLIKIALAVVLSEKLRRVLGGILD